jgi:hypothetical protein
MVGDWRILTLPRSWVAQDVMHANASILSCDSHPELLVLLRLVCNLLTAPIASIARSVELLHHCGSDRLNLIGCLKIAVKRVLIESQSILVDRHAVPISLRKSPARCHDIARVPSPLQRSISENAQADRRPRNLHPSPFLKHRHSSLRQQSNPFENSKLSRINAVSCEGGGEGKDEGVHFEMSCAVRGEYCGVHAPGGPVFGAASFAR